MTPAGICDVGQIRRGTLPSSCAGGVKDVRTESRNSRDYQTDRRQYRRQNRAEDADGRTNAGDHRSNNAEDLRARDKGRCHHGAELNELRADLPDAGGEHLQAFRRAFQPAPS